MELFIDGIEASDTSYNAIRDSDHPTDIVAKRFCEEMWEKFEPYADPHFLSQIQIDFHARFWEMYLTCTFLENNFKLSSLKEGPDICLHLDTRNIWIEAVAAKNSKELNGINKILKDPNKQAIDIPNKKIMLRYTSVIKDKMDKHRKYVAKGIIGEQEPYIIAINASQVTAAKIADSFESPPRIIKTVFGVGEENLKFNVDAEEVISMGFNQQLTIEKVTKHEGGKKKSIKISTDIFLDKEDGNNVYADLTGIFFSTANCNGPHNKGSDFVFAHNPFATNPIPHGTFRLGREYTNSIQGKENYEIRLINDWRKSN